MLRDGVLAQVAPPQELYRRPVDAPLAQFVGEGVLLPGTASAGFANCALGRLQLAKPGAEGPVGIMVRPEQIRFDPLAGRRRGQGEGFADHVFRPRRQRPDVAGSGRDAGEGPGRRSHGAGAGDRGVAHRRRGRDGLPRAPRRSSEPRSRSRADNPLRGLQRLLRAAPGLLGHGFERSLRALGGTRKSDRRPPNRADPRRPGSSRNAGGRPAFRS